MFLHTDRVQLRVMQREYKRLLCSARNSHSNSDSYPKPNSIHNPVPHTGYPNIINPIQCN